MTDSPPSSPRLVIELLYFDGCPNYRPLAARLRQVLDQSGVDADLRELGLTAMLLRSSRSS